MIEGTISLKKRNPQTVLPISPLPIIPARQKAPVKKNNVVEIIVHLDGIEHRFDYAVPLSSQLMSAQRGKSYLGELFCQLLSQRFGKAAKL